MTDRQTINIHTKTIITGICGISEMTLGGLFLENLKMEKQRTSMPYTTLAKNVLNQGIKGFEAGLIPWGCLIGFTKGSVLGFSHSIIKNKCHRYDLTDTQTTYISGFGSGAIQGAVISPLMLARNRLNNIITTRGANNTFNNSWTDELNLSMNILHKTIKSEGYGVMLAGMQNMIIRRALDWGCRFSINNKLCDKVKQYKNTDDLDVKDKIGIAFISGSLASIFTTPIDRFIPLLQSKSNTPYNMGLRENAMRVIKTQGITGLYRGYAMRAIHTGWHSIFIISLADLIYNNLHNNY